MIVKPKTRGFICTTAHPIGCANNVLEQIKYVKNNSKIVGPKKVLVIGASTGYGLASRIAASFGAGADTIGVFYERPATKNRTATAGWYNSAAFEQEAEKSGIYYKSINGDAFSNEIKQETIETIKNDLGKVDLVIYSLAAPKRVDSDKEVIYSSVIKPIGKSFTSKTVDFHDGVVSDITVDPATEIEIEGTIAVMGGEDWQKWMNVLQQADVLADGVKTVTYSYIGPEVTHPIYKDGTIGMAKEHLETSSQNITKNLKQLNGKAYVSVNKALVTQASSAIPVVPLYISILYKVMKQKNIHEGCIEQIYRLYKDFLYADNIELDQNGRIRIDNLEMKNDVQNEVSQLWDRINSENIEELSDIQGYRDEFFKLFGFGLDEINYEEDIDINIDINGIVVNL